VRLAPAAEAVPDRLAVGRSVQQRAAGLVEDGKRGVDPLHVLRRADGAVDIRRSPLHIKRKRGALADAVETEPLGNRHTRRDRLLNGRILLLSGLLVGRSIW